MKFEVPMNVAQLTVEDMEKVHESIQIFNGFIYFHRIPNPTAASVMYSSSYILNRLREVQYTRMVLDFTERELVDHKLRRLMLKQVADTDIEMTTVAIVLDGNSFRRVIIDFFVRAYLYTRDVDVRFFATKEEAIVYMQQSLTR